MQKHFLHSLTSHHLQKVFLYVASWQRHGPRGLPHPQVPHASPRERSCRSGGTGHRDYNSINPLYHEIDGMVAYDTFGQLRPDSSTKALSVASELGISVDPSTLLPSPDTLNSRKWEVAGASHVSYWDYKYIDPMILRDGWVLGPDGKPETLTASITGCSQGPAWSIVPPGYVVDSAIDHVNSWVRYGIPAPHAPLLTRDFSAPPIYDATTPTQTAPGYATNAIGHTAGGIQLAEYAYPIGDVKGSGTTGPGFCWLTGMHPFWTGAELVAHYPNPRAYLAGVIQQTEANLRAGYIVAMDAAATIRYATEIEIELLRLEHH